MADTCKDRAHDIHEQIQEQHDGDRDFAVCLECGASWAIVDCEDRNGCAYEDYEEIDEGDGFCLDRNAREVVAEGGAS